MTTNNTITPEQVEKTRAWVQASFDADETMNARHWIEGFFHPDGAIAHSGDEPAKGHKEMIAMFDYFNTKLTSVKHHAERIDVLPDRIYIQARVEFVVKKDPEQKVLSLEGLVAVDKKIDEDKASLYKIYTDKTPLVERIKMFD